MAVVKNSNVSGREYAKVKTNPVTGRMAFHCSGMQKPVYERRYRIGSWGDSRANPTGQTVASMTDTTGPASRVAAQAELYVGNAQFVFNGGYGGDVLSNWANSSRTGGKTLAALAAANLDVCLYQFGYNTIGTFNGSNEAAVTASGISDSVRQISAISKLVGYLLVESINPATAAGYSTYPVERERIRKAINTGVKSAVAGIKNVLYIDSDPTLIDPATGYARANFYADGVHFNELGAQTDFEINFRPILDSLMPGSAIRTVSGAVGPNLLDSAFVSSTSGLCNDITVNSNGGTSTISGFAIGSDERGKYQEFTVTPLTLSSGLGSVVARIHAPVAGASPLFSVVAGEKYGAGISAYADNGSGGAGACIGFGVRLRERYSVASGKTAKMSEVGSYQSSGAYAYKGPLVADWINIPAVVLNGSSADMEQFDTANPARGFCIELLTFHNSLTSYRVRLYEPAICKI